jgi:acetyl esterase/lipase
MTEPTKLGPPRPTLEFVAGAGPKELLFPPVQSILDGAHSYLNWPYAMIPGFRILRLDVHVPAETSGPVPVIVFAPGGAWLLAPKNHAPWRTALAQGYAVVSLEYRLSGEAKMPAQIHDVKAAIRWVRANAERFGFDTERVIGWGCSAGGYLMSMAGVTNGMADFEGEIGEHPGQLSALDAVIVHYAPSDLSTMGLDTNDIPGAVEQMGTISSPETRLLGFMPASNIEGAQRFNAAAYVSVETVPFLIMHGDADTRLGMRQSLRLHAALEEAGTDVEFHAISGANHAGPEFESPQVIEPLLAFLRRVATA